MLNFDSAFTNDNLLTETYSVTNQTFDQATLNEMRKKYGIIFMTNKTGTIPVKIYYHNNLPQIALGEEDDGIIKFYRYKNSDEYALSFGACWIKYLIADLQSAEKFIKNNPDKKQFIDCKNKYSYLYEDDK